MVFTPRVQISVPQPSYTGYRVQAHVQDWSYVSSLSQRAAASREPRASARIAVTGASSHPIFLRTRSSDSATSLGFNLLGSPINCGSLLSSTDIIADPLLKDFVDDGTAGQGHLPLSPQSPAIDAVARSFKQAGDVRRGDRLLQRDHGEATKRLHEELGKTLIMVTHDPKTAGFADQTLHLEKGKLVEPAVVAALRDRVALAGARGPRANIDQFGSFRVRARKKRPGSGAPLLRCL